MHRIALIGIAAVMVACTDLSVPPEPTRELSASSGVDLAALRRGHGVYLTQCGSCHELIHPKKFKPEDWKLVIPGMCWNAGVNRADQAALMAYLNAASRNGL
jgi:hypothetical protein